MADSFSGFSKQALSFFRQLKKNNDRTWFATRKDFYDEQVKRPMELLVADVGDRIRRFAVQYAPADPKRSIYRLYRDTRFSKDKTPYKTHIAAHFFRQGFAKGSGPQYYLQVSHEYVGVFGGIYLPGPEELKAIRQGIAGDLKAFEKLVGNKKLIKSMGLLQGDTLTRPPKGFEPGTPGEPYIRMKQFYFWKQLDADLALDRKLPAKVAEHFATMVPFLEHLTDLLTAAAAADEENRPKRPAPMF